MGRLERGQGECGEEDKTREERDGWLKERGGRDAPQGHVAKPPASHLQAETAICAPSIGHRRSHH